MPETVSSNPLVERTSDPADIFPLLELKQHLVLYLEKPPSASEARFVYETYRDRFGDRIKRYRATTPGSLLMDWDAQARSDFEHRRLPDLRRRADWGYWFWDGKGTDSWQFVFHGFKPVSQAGTASFYRFEFDWAVAPDVLLGLAVELMGQLEFSSGYGGYSFHGRPSSMYHNLSYNRMFAWAHRYWGVEAQDLDVTVNHVLGGYKCVNWLTMIGEPLRREEPQAVKDASAAAFHSSENRHGVLLLAHSRPLLGDRNRGERLEGYARVAEALLPLQLDTHGAFSGTRWTDENTMAWMRRFTHPEEVGRT